MKHRARLLTVLVLELVSDGILGGYCKLLMKLSLDLDYTQVLGSPSELGLSLGEFPPVRMLVMESAHYRLDASFDHEWDALIPANGTVGYTRDGEPYSVAIFHQLRCLDLIRRDFGRIQSTGVMSRSPHARSCLNYLRTTALCQSDMHIESFTEEDNTESTHWYVCRDWTTVYQTAATAVTAHAKRA